MSIAREHGGTIEAEALPAGGSAFTLYLPAALEAPERREAASSAPQDASAVTEAQNSAPVLKGRSVLVLDDEESICMLLEEGLSAHGLEVRCTATPEEALASVPEHRFDALICDLNLSVRGAPVNGADVAQKLLELAKTPKPALILMTGDYAQELAPGVG